MKTWQDKDEERSVPYLLYAEDNIVDCTFFTRALSHCNDSLRLVHHPDGTLVKRYLLDIVAENAPLPQLVVLDIKMPGLSGIEVLKFIRNHPTLHRLPVLLLSSSSLETDIIQAYENTVNAYLVKPDQYSKFKELIGSINRFWINHNKVAA